MLVLFRSGYSVFCQKYLSKHTTSAVTRFKVASVAWNQLSPAKKNHYQKKASKVVLFS